MTAERKDSLSASAPVRPSLAADSRDALVKAASVAGRARTEGAPCQRCGFLVPPKLMGCKNPCPNCGTVYPHGDCSD